MARLRELQTQSLTRDQLLMKIGAAKKAAGRTHALVAITLPQPDEPVNAQTFILPTDLQNEWLWGIVGGLVGYPIGAAVNSPPAGTVAVAGYPSYQYYGGAFYEPAPSGQGYVTAPAPVGAAVEAPPVDCTIVFGPDDQGYRHFQGALFTYHEKTDNYVVARPPVGIAVLYLPDGHAVKSVSRVEYYELGGVDYRPYYEGDDVSYVVSKLEGVRRSGRAPGHAPGPRPVSNN